MELGEFTDGQLLLMYAHGNEGAFSELFERHHASLHRFLLRMTNNVQDAEEVLQETFVRVARAAIRYEPTAAFTTWLFRIASNRCLSHLGRRKNFTLLRFPLQEAASTAAAPFEQVRERELEEAHRGAVARLPLALRSAYVLREFEHFTYEEAATILNVPVGTVKTHVHRARMKLRQRLTSLLKPKNTVSSPAMKGRVNGLSNS